ncbi:hypothetical protein GSB9_00406 [Flavobacteriaceae bacterium GSB9]|nr:hypothetical protein GSB9_00406 [Flavobacteriaceae bacterium GSB9]
MKTTLLSKFAAFCVLVFTVGTLSAQNAVTWTGAVDTVFVNPANWDPNGIPDATSDVTIGADATNLPHYITTLSEAGNANDNVNLLNGSNSTLTIWGLMTVARTNYFGGNLVLDSIPDTPGGSLDIRGQSRFGLVDNPATITVKEGTVLNSKNQLIIGESGDATLNIQGGMVTSTLNGLILGGYAGNGKINLTGGELHLAGGFAINEAGAGTGELYINGGTLYLAGDQTTVVNDYVAAGKITTRPSRLIGAQYDEGADETFVVSYDPGDAIMWTGAADTDFTNPANWDLGIIPEGSDDVSVDPDAPNAPTLSVSLRSVDPANNFLQGAVSHMTGTPGVPITIAAPLAMWAGGGNFFSGDLNIEEGADVNIRNQARFGQGPATTINVNGGLINSKNYLILADGGDATLNINGGRYTSTGQGILLGGYSGYGTVNITSGSLELNGAYDFDVRADRSGAGHITISDGSLILGGDQRGLVDGWVADGKIKVAPGYTLDAPAFDFTNTTITASAGAPAKEVAYLTASKTMGAGASAVDNDAIIRMLQADPNFNVTVIVDPAADIDLSGYDLAIVQETFGSSSAIFSGTGSAAIQNISIPTIFNKTYAWNSGKAGITETDANIVASTATSIDVPHGERRSDPLFSGIDFSEGNSVRIFAELANDDGTPGGSTGFQILNDLDIVNNTIGGSSGSLHAQVPDVTTPSAAIVFNELRPGVQLGENTEDVLGAPVIAFSMNYGAIALGDGANLSSEALTIWRNAAYHLTGMISPDELYVNPDYVAPVIDLAYVQKAGFTSDASASSSTNDPIIRMFQADDNFNVTVIETDADGTGLDLTGYDLVIAQETFGSGDGIWTGPLAPKNLTIPFIMNKSWALRDGKAISSAGAIVELSAETKVSIDPSNQSNMLFNGIDFSGGNDVILYNELADNTGAAGSNAIDVLNNLEISVTGTNLATVADVTTSPDTSIIINSIPEGTQLGTDAADLTKADMVAFAFNYGAIIRGDGANISPEALTIWRNAAYMLAGEPVPSSLVANPDFTLGIDKAGAFSNVSSNVRAIGSRIYVSDVKSSTEVNIYSMTGALVKTIKTNTDTNFSFNSGLWIATVKTLEGTKAVKLLVK